MSLHALHNNKSAISVHYKIEKLLNPLERLRKTNINNFNSVKQISVNEHIDKTKDQIK